MSTIQKILIGLLGMGGFRRSGGFRSRYGFGGFYKF